MTREEKDNIDRLVNIWLSGLQSSSNDAGWQGMSLAARLIEYLGEPPGPTGNDQSNLTMINAIRMLRDQHPEYPMIAAAMSMLLRLRDTRDLATALAAKHLWRGLCPFTDRTWTNEDRASALEMSPSAYEWALGRAYPAVMSELERVHIYARFIA
ncbi:MAG: hypothetical protein Q8L60_10755 [Gammaproteobacteria bacterium]|nr:hypothetical protein [Gammaproteobacteria bacterium]MDP2346827.1 hypothetical protein [Gammaproteobacteria bacterium]